MIALLQRVKEARVDVGDRCTGQIGPGLLLLICAEPQDSEAVAEKLLHKILRLRIFSDLIRVSRCIASERRRNEQAERKSPSNFREIGHSS